MNTNNISKNMQSYVLIAKKKGVKNISLSKFSAKSSKKAIYSNIDTASKAVSPFGATEYLNSVAEASKIKTLDANDIASFKTAAKCSDCGTHWVASANFRKENEKFNCMICASELEIVTNPEQMNELVQDIVEDEMHENQEVDTVEELQELIEESSEDDEDDITYFEVFVEDGDKKGIFSVEKSGSKWLVDVLEGNLEHHGKNYQSYLTPKDIINWMKKDYDLVELQQEITAASEDPLENLTDDEEIEIILDDEDNSLEAEMVESEEDDVELSPEDQAIVERAEEILHMDLDGDDEEGEDAEHVEQVLEENASDEDAMQDAEQINELPEDATIAPESVEEMILPEGLEAPEEKEESYDKYNLATLLNKAEYKDKIELVLSSLENSNPCYYILVNRSPVAMAEFKNASEEVKALFADSDTFGKAFIAALDNMPQTEATASLKNFGVKPIMAPVVSKKSVIAYSVKKIEKKLEASFKKREQDMFATWQQCFSTALVASCKGLKRSSDGKAKNLVVKATLVDTMKSVGIQNANVLVEEAFKRGIQRDFGHIVEEALSLYQGTPEKREAWAMMVGEADYAQDNSLVSIQASASNVSSLQDQKVSFKVESALDERYNVFDSLISGVRNKVF